MRKNEKTDIIDVIEVMEVEGKPLAGMRICVTGHMSKTRAEIVKLIEQGGGEFHSSVKFDTTHLLTNKGWSENSVDGTSSKFKKARQYGCRVISEDRFLTLLTEGHSILS